MLKRLLTEDGELTKISRRFVWMLVIIYCLIIVRMCFGPQIMIEGVSTPNVQRFGRIVALLVPFNSFRSLDQLTSFKEIFLGYWSKCSEYFTAVSSHYRVTIPKAKFTEI